MVKKVVGIALIDIVLKVFFAVCLDEGALVMDLWIVILLQVFIALFIDMPNSQSGIWKR